MEKKVIDLIIKGGIVIYPIILCSVIALTIFIERVLILRRKSVIPEGLVDAVEEKLKKKNIAGALEVCENSDSSIAKIFLAGLKNSGKVVAVGRDVDGQLSVGTWKGIVQVAAGKYHTVGLKSDGTVVCVGKNDWDQNNVSSWNLLGVK